MANPHRAEQQFQIDDEIWTFRYTVNAIAELEELLDLTQVELFEFLQTKKGQGAKTVRALFWAGLLSRHPDVKPSQAGELMDELGQQRVGEIIKKGWELYVPDSANAVETKGTRPRQSKAGTGPGSGPIGSPVDSNLMRSGTNHSAKSS